jgi:serine acetyltransferase
VIAAILVGLIGILLANFSGEAVLIAAVNAQIQGARLIANMVRWGVMIFTGAMVLTQLRIAKEIVVAAFSITFGGIVLALAIALGLGGRGIAKQALERRLRREKAPDEFTHI